jgi:hypothetical protein
MPLAVQIEDERRIIIDLNAERQVIPSECDLLARGGAVFLDAPFQQRLF